jgi:hypothetical protein
MSNKFTFIQTGSADSKKYYVLCSMCMIDDEETFKNLVILENLRFTDLEKLKQTRVAEEDGSVYGVKSCIAQAFKISGNQYFIWDSLKEIIDKFIADRPNYEKVLKALNENNDVTIGTEFE